MGPVQPCCLAERVPSSSRVPPLLGGPPYMPRTARSSVLAWLVRECVVVLVMLLPRGQVDIPAAGPARWRGVRGWACSRLHAMGKAWSTAPLAAAQDCKGERACARKGRPPPAASGGLGVPACIFCNVCVNVKKASGHRRGPGWTVLEVCV